jgi:hypothetical protein
MRKTLIMVKYLFAKYNKIDKKSLKKGFEKKYFVQIIVLIINLICWI